MKTVKTTVTTVALLLCAAFAAAPGARAAYLIAPSDDDNPVFRAQVAGFLGDTVDYLDARSATPTLAELLAYDGVFTWVNDGYANSTAFGDALADYVDGGGLVVLGAFTTYTVGNFLDGRIMTSGYSPVVSPGATNAFASSTYTGDGVTSLWNGVGSYGATHRDIVILQGTGILDGTFADGSIAAAYRPDGKVIYLGGMETLTQTTGDSAQLLANALGSPITGGAVPEPASFGLAGLGLIIVGAASRLRKRSLD